MSLKITKELIGIIQKDFVLERDQGKRYIYNNLMNATTSPIIAMAIPAIHLIISILASDISLESFVSTFARCSFVANRSFLD